MRWLQVRQVEQRARRLGDIMAALGTDPLALARLDRGEAFNEARALCLSCSQVDRCQDWLALPAEARDRPAFCPNLALLERCRTGRQG